MTCKECLYYEVCKDYLVKCAEHGEAERINNPCTKFKNKADFVEVVRCKDCKHWHKKVFDPIIEHHIGECHCSQWENDYFWYETNENNFCSYGERKNDFKE